MKRFSKSYFIIFFTFIVLFGASFLLYYVNLSKNDYIELAKKGLEQEAIAHFDNMVNTRTWNAQHGGIYALAVDGQQPNKYLIDNHTYTKDDKLLIKINPAWMTRQISEIANKNSNYKYKITSLKPINPGNKADKFEEKALKFFEKNKDVKFYSEFTDKSYDFMGSLKVEPECMACHIHQGYKIGDIRGGLRVSIPIENYNNKITLIKTKNSYLTYIIIFITSIFLIMGMYFINVIYKRQQDIETLNMELEEKVKLRTQELEINLEKLHELATIDFLTQIPNRRYFFELSNKLFSLAKRDKTELSLLMIDIDFFKNVNDEYGHFIGDEVLKLVTKKLYTNIRNSDILARMGGEEFVILLNETGKDGSIIIAEKLRTIIEKSILEYDSLSIKVTISIGISVLDFENDKEIDDILIRADEALYISKDSGRNRVTVKKF